MFQRLLLLSLAVVGSLAILEFKLLVDNRIVNEKNQINPFPYIREGYKVMKPYENSTDQQQLDVLRNWIRATYPQQANMLNQFNDICIDVFKQLPASLKAEFHDQVSALNNNSIPTDFSLDQIQAAVPAKDLWNRIQNTIIPMAKQIFYNPLDQDANAKLPANQVTVIQHKFF